LQRAPAPSVRYGLPPIGPSGRGARPIGEASGVAVIVVSGPPASGKTWWGNRLSSVLGIPYLNRDDFKASVYPLFAEFGVPPGRAPRQDGTSG
jgi:hypothetical protein